MLSQSGVSVLFLARGFKKCDYIHARRRMTSAPACGVVRHRRPIGRLPRRRPARRSGDSPPGTVLTCGEAITSVHLRHHQLPRERRSRTQHPSTTPITPAPPSPTAKRDRVCISAGRHLQLRWCSGLACTTHAAMSVPAEAFDPLAVLECRRRKKFASMGCQPCSSPSWTIRALRVRPDIPAPAYGGPCHRADEERRHQMHIPGRDRLRHDRDVAASTMASLDDPVSAASAPSARLSHVRSRS